MSFTRALIAASLWLGCVQAHAAGGVMVTPLGSHDGELCALDRALLFEDPDGTRILYDPRPTVTDALFVVPAN